MDGDTDFIHHFEPGTDGSGRTLLLLHGTGGTERDLVPLAQGLVPGAAILSPRGKVLEGGAAVCCLSVKSIGITRCASPHSANASVARKPFVVFHA